jgi:hypothetical protein
MPTSFQTPNQIAIKHVGSPNISARGMTDFIAGHGAAMM